MRALVIDDDPAVCRKLCAWLTAASYDVATFTDPDQAILNASRASFQVALVDLRLPTGDGAEVIASLRRVAPQARIVAMSAFPDARQVIAAVRAGASDLLEKPIQQAGLLEAMERQLAAFGITVRSEADFNRRLGARLRSLRQAQQLTLSDVAAASGITAAQLSQIELGKTATSTWTLARICGALHKPLSALFNDL